MRGDREAIDDSRLGRDALRDRSIIGQDLRRRRPLARARRR
jgi:hypothetical protein